MKGRRGLNLRRLKEVEIMKRILLSVCVLTVVYPVWAWADSVSWISGSISPAQWSISPEYPSTADVIHFSGPTSVFGSSCVAEQNFGGTPQVYMLPSTNTIILWFQGPPPATCTAIYDPVAGLEGEIGPLPAGDWTLLGVSPGATFNLSFTVGSSTIYHVDADAPGPVYDGSSWDQAFLTLQDALVTAHAGDSIWVAQGTYQPDQGGTASAGDREASFVLPDGVTVMGGFAGYGEPNEDARDPEGTPSILTGDLQGDDLFGLLMLDDNSYHVVTLSGGSATLDGFHIMSGQATGGYPHQFGGGLTLEFGDLVVKDCVLEMNRGNFGAAIANLGGSLQLVNTILMGNRATVLLQRCISMLPAPPLVAVKRSIWCHNLQVLGLG